MKVKPIVIIIPLLIAILGLVTGSFLVWQLLIFSVLILGFGYLWLIINTRGIEVKVKDLPDYSRVGDWFEEEFVVTNNSSLPKSGVMVSGRSDLPGYENTYLLKSGIKIMLLVIKFSIGGYTLMEVKNRLS